MHHACGCTCWCTWKQQTEHRDSQTRTHARTHAEVARRVRQRTEEHTCVACCPRAGRTHAHARQVEASFKSFLARRLSNLDSAAGGSGMQGARGRATVSHSSRTASPSRHRDEASVGSPKGSVIGSEERRGGVSGTGGEEDTPRSSSPHIRLRLAQVASLCSCSLLCAAPTGDVQRPSKALVLMLVLALVK